jgi:hypothetical protein
MVAPSIYHGFSHKCGTIAPALDVQIIMALLLGSVKTLNGDGRTGLPESITFVPLVSNRCSLGRERWKGEGLIRDSDWTPVPTIQDA